MHNMLGVWLSHDRPDPDLSSTEYTGQLPYPAVGGGLNEKRKNNRTGA